MSQSQRMSENFNTALVAVGLLWSSNKDGLGTSQTVLVAASDPRADPDARNPYYLASMACAVMTRNTTMADLASAVKDKFDGDGANLIAILGS